MKKLFLCGMLSFALILSGCGSDDDDEDSNPIPTQPEVIERTKVTLGSNTSEVNLNNVAQAKFSKEFALTNPEITIEKSKSAVSQLIFDDSKNVLEIQDGSDYEVGIVSSKELTSEFDITLNVPESLISKLNDNNDIVIYVEDPDDGDEKGLYLPIKSIFNSTTKTVSAKVTDRALGNKNIKFKIGLVTVFDAATVNESPPGSPPTIAAAAKEEDFRDINLPPQGDLVTQNLTVYPCPLTECIESSRFGIRLQKNGNLKMHKGIDFLVKDKPVKAIAAGKITDLDNAWGMVEVTTSGEKNKAITKVRYYHMKLPLQNTKGQDWKIGDSVGVSEVIGISSNTSPPDEPVGFHLHVDILKPILEARKEGTVMFDVVDPFSYFLGSVKIVNTSKKTNAVIGDDITLALEGKSVDGAKVDSQISTKDFPKGTTREVGWESSNRDSSSVLGQPIASVKSGSSAILNIKAIEPAIITARWDGSVVDGLQANYSFNTRFKDLKYTAVIATKSDCPGDTGTETVTGIFKSLDQNKPTYRIDARRTTFTETIPAVGAQTLIFPEEGGNTTDSYVYKIDFDGFNGSGTYQFVRLITDPETGEVTRFVCNGTYTIEGTFVK